MEGPREEGTEPNVMATVQNFLWQRYWAKRFEQEAVHKRMLDDQFHYQQQQLQQQQNQRQNGQQPDAFFRPWEQPPANQQANIAVVRPFHSQNQNLLSRVMPSRENLHKKLLRGNHLQYQHRYQYQQQQQQQIHVNCMSSSVNHAPESVILSRPLFLETSNNENETIKLIPKTTVNSSSLSLPKCSRTFINQSVRHDLDPESENSNDLIICEENNDEQSEGDSEEEIDCESVSSESSSTSQPLDLRTTKIPYSSTAEYEISVIRSLSPVTHRVKESARERKSRKLKTKRRICTACKRTYLKTKNLRWHFKSKMHLKRVKKLGIDDPANQPDTWYRTSTSEQHDHSTNFLENIMRDESNI